MLPANLTFILNYPITCFSLFAFCTLLALGSNYFVIIRKYAEESAFLASLVFSLFLSFIVYVKNLDFYIMRYYWVFIALAGMCFSKRYHLLLLLLVSYAGSAVVHILLPADALPHPMWSYLLLTPPLMIIYYNLVSQSIWRQEKLMKNEASLRQKTEELDTILNTLNAMVAFKDNNNVYKKVNRTMGRFLGLTPEEAEGKSLYDLVHPDLAKTFHEEDMLVMKAGKASLNKLEIVASPATGKKVWLRYNKLPYIDENGEIAGVVFSADDVTEQVLAEIKIRESEERFRMIFENAPDGMALIENPTWRFIRVNKAYVEMLGFEEEEVLSLSPYDLVHPEDESHCRQLYHDVMFEGITHHTSEKRYIHKSGRIVHCSLSVFVVKENYLPKYMIVSLKDITLQKENDLRLKRYARQLEESNQNLQEFAYAASHDLREPLRTVVSYVQLLKRQLPDQHLSTSAEEFMQFVIGGAMRMENQIQALLEYSRVGKGELKLSRFDLKDAVENVCAGLKKQMIDNNAIVEAECLPKITGDRFQIEALFQNLISNAIKYRNPEKQPVIVITAQELEHYWQISVSDNGIGIEEEFLEKIFAVFRRLHNTREIPGTGVGLAICRRIVQRHGGNIWADATPGIGSTFHITLPKMIELNLLVATTHAASYSIQD